MIHMRITADTLRPSLQGRPCGWLLCRLAARLLPLTEIIKRYLFAVDNGDGSIGLMVHDPGWAADEDGNMRLLTDAVQAVSDGEGNVCLALAEDGAGL